MARFLPTILDDLEDFYDVVNCCRGYQKKLPSNISVSEDEQKLYIDAALPGVKSEDIQVTVDPKKRMLIIGGEAKLGRENVKYHFKGLYNYHYEIPLSNEVDLDTRTEATSKDGILTIALSKNKSDQPLKIEVKVG